MLAIVLSNSAKKKRGDVNIYLWALYRPHREPEKGFGDLGYLIWWLYRQKLPGEAPSDWVVMLLKFAESKGRSVYVYDKGGPDQWTVTLSQTGVKALPRS